MTARVLTALRDDVESRLVTILEDSPDVTVVRRCADVEDLLAAASAGLADCALVSAGLRGLDRDTVATMADHGTGVVGVTATTGPGDVADEADERVLRQIGVATVVSEDTDVVRLGDAITEAVGALGAGRRSRDAEPPGRTPPATSGGPGSARTEHDGRLVAVWGPTGAPGRTTVAVNVSAELAARGTSVLLVDADTWGAGVAQALALIDETPGLVAAARASEQGRLDRVGLARLAPVVPPGFRVLTGLPRADRWPEVRRAAYEQVLDLARTLADVIVVDCGFAVEDDEELSYDTDAPRRNVTTVTTLARADLVLAVGSADPVGLQRLVRGVQDLRELTSADVRVLVNKVRASAVGTHPERRIADVLARFAGHEDVAFLPWDLEGCDAAMLAGVCLGERAARSPLRVALRDVAGSLA